MLPRCTSYRLYAPESYWACQQSCHSKCKPIYKRKADDDYDVHQISGQELPLLLSNVIRETQDVVLGTTPSSRILEIALCKIADHYCVSAHNLLVFSQRVINSLSKKQYWEVPPLTVLFEHAFSALRERASILSWNSASRTVAQKANVLCFYDIFEYLSNFSNIVTGQKGRRRVWGSPCQQ